MMFRVGLIFGLFTIYGILGLEYYIEDVYIEKIDPEYFDVDETNIEVVWINVTLSGITMNFTLIKSLPDSTTSHLNLYLKTMGEYKTHSGISANVPWCDALADPVIIGSVMGAMGMTKENCPPPPGHYGTPFWAPSTELMPDYFPGIDYKVTFAVMNKKSVLILIWLFVSLF